MLPEIFSELKVGPALEQACRAFDLGQVDRGQHRVEALYGGFGGVLGRGVQVDRVMSELLLLSSIKRSQFAVLDLNGVIEFSLPRFQFSNAIPQPLVLAL